VAYSYVSTAEAAERVIVKSKLAKTVAVEVQISTAFVVLAIPATMLPAPEYLEELTGATASTITGFTSVTFATAHVIVPPILTSLTHSLAALALAAPRADEVTAAARLVYLNLPLAMHSKVVLSAAMFMVEPLRMVMSASELTLSASNEIPVP